ncbi:MAG TPA: hypothetical protein PKJ58_08550 [Prolixibacteraceae bacterium]|nr:hypothetical protein [Prolixibacteraceae bacterium]
MDRKGFIEKGLRLVLTGGLLAAAGYLVASGRISSGPAQGGCGNSRHCGDCRLAAKCEFKEKASDHGRR